MPKVSVTTRSFTAARDGANTAETILTPAAVKAKGIARLFSLQTQGDARGCEAQPLIIADVVCQDGLTHDLIVMATMGNVIDVRDANDGTPIWMKRVGNPIKGTRAIDGFLINDNWGILGTPVYDASTGLLYVVSWSSPDKTPAKSKFTMLKIEAATGNILGTLDLSGATYTPGNGLPVQKFSSAARKQRPALLLSQVYPGVVYIAFGTIAETASTAQGWIIAVDTAKWKVKGAWTSTVRGSGAGIWMAGQGPSEDVAGNVYFMTGNGSFDGITDFGECFVKLNWVKNKLTCLDHWAGWNDAGREGLDPVTGKAKTVGSATDDDGGQPTNVRNYDNIAMGGYDDMDLGSGAPVPINALDLIPGAGKDGILYPVRMSNMGGTVPADLANPAANYAKLASQPIFFTYYTPDRSPAPQDVTQLNFLYGGRTHHQHSAPVYWLSAQNGHMIFNWGENGNLRAWSVDPTTKAVRYLACGAEVASAGVTNPPGGMPGGMITLSANGSKDGVVWALIPIGDANSSLTQGRLLAYSADDVSGGTLKVLWDSAQWNIYFVFNKFGVAVPANGKLYVPTYSGSIDVYGLTPAA